MRLPTTNQIETSLKVIIVATLTVLLVLSLMLRNEYRRLSHLNTVSAHQSWLTTLRSRGPATANDVGTIQTWMTFEYINRLFSLPPEYLRSSLSISDSRYPRMTIARYARDTQSNAAALNTRVQDAVRAYFAQKQ